MGAVEDKSVLGERAAGSGGLLSSSTLTTTTGNIGLGEGTEWKEVHMEKLEVGEAVDAIVSVVKLVRSPFFLILLPSLSTLLI